MDNRNIVNREYPRYRYSINNGLFYLSVALPVVVMQRIAYKLHRLLLLPQLFVGKDNLSVSRGKSSIYSLRICRYQTLDGYPK